MFSLKRRYSILLIILLLILSAFFYGWNRWQHLKKDLGLNVEWQGFSIGLQGIQWAALKVTQTTTNGDTTQLTGKQVTLSWSHLRIKQLEATWQAGNFTNEPVISTASSLDIDSYLKNFSWAPHHIQIDKFLLTLPCASGQCSLSGKLIVNQKPQPDLPLSLVAAIEHQKQILTFNAKLYQRQQLMDLQITAQLNQRPFLSFANQFDPNKLNQWQGHLTIDQLTNAQGLFDWLQEWLPHQQTVTQIPDSMQLNAKWQLAFADKFTSFQPKQGYFNLDASLPNPWPIIGIGYAQGHITSNITFDKRPRIEQLDTQIQITQIDKALIKKLPDTLQPDAISLTVTPIEIPIDIQADRAIAINLNLTGKVNTSLTSNIYINSPQMELMFGNALLQANSSTLLLNNYNLLNSRLALPFTAKVTPKQADIKLDKTAIITIQQLNTPDFSAKNLQLTLGDLVTQLNYANSSPFAMTTKGTVTAATTALTQSLLKTTRWKLAGQLSTDLKRSLFTGKLTNGAELSANIKASTDYQKQVTLTAQTPDLFFRTTNVFAKTLKNWPDVLEIVNGKINITSTLTIPLNDNNIKLNAVGKLSGLSGIYDRSEFRDLSGSVDVALQNNQLKITLPDLTLTEANPGINMGPLQFIGQYSADLNKITQGILQWSTAELTLFTGNVWLKAGQLNLAKLPQQLDLQIKNVQLNALLQAYPTEGLNGEGILDGSLPIIITPQGIDVKEGKLGARQAGFIKFNSPQIKAVGANNPNMKLVTESLENFQYTLLNSQVSYDNGKAILGLQIKGRNPDVKDGQPINLNITLQEDIPALMTTLQLSDRVSETIRLRVQKRLQQRSSKNQ